ncbi:MAG TPA: cyclase family protein [Terriglobales bacterium]|jgi:kynurenine formamidase|nr:cyclase family protein [Terriglobales bacterium]
MRKTLTLGLALLVAALVFAGTKTKTSKPAPVVMVVDLTHLLSEKSPNWEGTEKSPFEAKQLGSIQKDGYFSRYISLPEHFSTHIDAPAHFAAGRWTVDQIPAQRLVAPLVVIDVRAQAAKDVDYRVTPGDVAAWERAHGRIPEAAVVMAFTGWDSRWSSMKDYRNADAKGAMHFPGFALETAKLLVSERHVVGLGIDTLSIDYGPSPDYPAHQFVLAQNVYQLENVTNLGAVPAVGATLVVGAAKLEGGSGGPVRLLALVRGE